MSGTRAGGLKARAKNLAKDPYFYIRNGAKGGRIGTTGGFAANPELARIAGAKGGKVSKRGKARLRSQEEVIEQIEKRREKDMLGFEWSMYLDVLSYDNVKKYLKKDAVSRSKWNDTRIDSVKELKQNMIDYLPFAWEKANGFRGLSAQRSIMHYVAWFWLIGDDYSEELREKFMTQYQYYGKDLLTEISERLGKNPKIWDDGVRRNDEA